MLYYKLKCYTVSGLISGGSQWGTAHGKHVKNAYNCYTNLLSIKRANLSNLVANNL